MKSSSPQDHGRLQVHTWTVEIVNISTSVGTLCQHGRKHEKRTRHAQIAMTNPALVPRLNPSTVLTECQKNLAEQSSVLVTKTETYIENKPISRLRARTIGWLGPTFRRDCDTDAEPCFQERSAIESGAIGHGFDFCLMSITHKCITKV